MPTSEFEVTNRHLSSRIVWTCCKNKLINMGTKEMQTVSRGTKDQVLIGKKIKKGCNRQLTSLAVTWIDYRKA